MSDYTPEQMLDLARAAMPDAGWEPAFIPGDPPFRNHQLDWRELFDPLGNPAHAWAVEQWLFDRREKPYSKVEKTNATASGSWRYDIHYGRERFDLVIDSHNTNLAAAVAVMERMKGESE